MAGLKQDDVRKGTRIEGVSLPFKVGTMQKPRGHAGGASPLSLSSQNPVCLGAGQPAQGPVPRKPGSSVPWGSLAAASGLWVCKAQGQMLS